MAADEAGVLKCRLSLEATWTNDGSVEGAVDNYVSRHPHL
jgi:putative ATP-dependent endonuclease of the OLD family